MYGSIQIVFMVLFLIVTRIQAQDTIKPVLSNLLWENEIEILDNDTTLLHSKAIQKLNNQELITNCWSDFYRYSQNIRQPLGEMITYYTFEHCGIKELDSGIYGVFRTRDPDTGEPNESLLFKYMHTRSGDNNMLIDKDEILSNFTDSELVIEKLIIRDSTSQVLDSCLTTYKLMLKSDRTFTQGYPLEDHCRCWISVQDFGGKTSAKSNEIDVADHSLIGSTGAWKIIDDKIYFKFDNGVVIDYQFEIMERTLILKHMWSDIYLEEMKK